MGKKNIWKTKNSSIWSKDFLIELFWKTIASWEFYNKREDFEDFLYVKNKNWEVSKFHRKRISDNSDIEEIKSPIVKNLWVYFLWTQTKDKSLLYLINKEIKLTNK